jgi:hypothetical protein
VHLPRRKGQDGSEKETCPVGKVVGRKRKDDGTRVGSYHPDSRYDTAEDIVIDVQSVANERRRIRIDQAIPRIHVARLG